MRKLALLALILATAVALALPEGAPAQKGPIKIGFLIPETGPLAANGKDMANGFQLFFEEQAWKLAGREVKLITEDDEGKPPTGLAKARSLVESQGVHVLVGPLSAAVGYAIYFFTYSSFLARPTLYLEDVFVLQEHRGKGAGKAFFAALRRAAKKARCGRMEWTVLNWNLPAIKFYDAQGARPLKEWTTYRLEPV